MDDLVGSGGANDAREVLVEDELTGECDTLEVDVPEVAFGAQGLLKVDEVLGTIGVEVTEVEGDNLGLLAGNAGATGGRSARRRRRSARKARPGERGQTTVEMQ